MIWQPTLSSKLLRLRPVREDDFGALLAAASDPKIWELHPEPTRWQPEVFARYFRGAIDSQGGLVIEDARTGQIIGSSRFTEHDPAKRFVEIGYTFLTRPYWGGQYNRDLKSLMLGHAFTLVDTVWFVVGQANWRSRRAMEKIGGVLVPFDESPFPSVRSGSVFYRVEKVKWVSTGSA